MSYIANSYNYSQHIAITAAKNGLMHFSECQDDYANPDREFFATREEADASALEKCGYDEAAGIEFRYEARSMWFDNDGNLIIAEDEGETQENA